MPHWSPDPDDVIKFRASGTGNMGVIADDSSTPRFGLAEKFVLVYMRAWTTGGIGSANMDLFQWIASERSARWDQVVQKFPLFGTDGEPFKDFRIIEGEYQHWVWDGGDRILPVWTNPDSGNMEWAVEVGLAKTPRQA